MQTGKTTRLGTIINVREIQKKQTTRELMHISEEKKSQQEVLDKMNGEHQSAMDSTFKDSRTRASAVQTSSAFLKRLGTQIKQQTTNVKTIESQEDVKRDELLERSKAKTIVEKLQDKFNEENRKEADRKEQKLIDTIGQRTMVNEA